MSFKSPMIFSTKYVMAPFNNPLKTMMTNLALPEDENSIYDKDFGPESCLENNWKFRVMLLCLQNHYSGDLSIYVLANAVGIHRVSKIS